MVSRMAVRIVSDKTESVTSAPSRMKPRAAAVPKRNPAGPLRRRRGPAGGLGSPGRLSEQELQVLGGLVGLLDLLAVEERRELARAHGVTQLADGLGLDLA